MSCFNQIPLDIDVMGIASPGGPLDRAARELCHSPVRSRDNTKLTWSDACALSGEVIVCTSAAASAPRGATSEARPESAERR